MNQSKHSLSLSLSPLSLSLCLSVALSPQFSLSLSPLSVSLWLSVTLSSLWLSVCLCLCLSVCLLSACVDDDDEDFVETRAYATSANIAKAMTRGEIILDGLCSYQSGTGSGISVSWRDYGPC
jgi:hypothetical protein